MMDEELVSWSNRFYFVLFKQEEQTQDNLKDVEKNQSFTMAN